MKLSVIIPVYNVSAWLDECMNSVFDQHVDDLEVILVDDGSTDSSGSLCDRWAAAHDNIRVVHQANKGLSGARNTGLDLATGDLITFVDSDDRLGTNTWRDNIPFFTTYPDIDVVEFPVREYEHSNRERLLNFDPRRVTALDRKGRILESARKGRSDNPVFVDWVKQQGYAHCYAWNKIYRAALWKDRRFPVGQVFEDTAVMPYLIRCCGGIFYSARGCYHYLCRKGSISNTWHYTDCRQLFLNTLTLWNECHTVSALKNHLRSLRKEALNRVVDMGRCKDCNKTDLARQLARLTPLERMTCKLRIYHRPQL